MVLIALLALAAWVVLILGRGGFWRADQVLPATREPDRWPGLAVVIPARDEAETIRAVVEAHRQADYPGALRVFVCDDHSSDRTAEEAREATGAFAISLVPVPDLPPGWSGKLWALEAGVVAAAEEMPDADYFLFTDADILVSGTLLRKMVAHAERSQLSLVSIMARLDASGFWGGLLVPAFIFFFQKLYPFPLVNDPGSATAAAAGGVVLLRKEALEKIGGIAAIRSALIDDCTLAAKVKAEDPRHRIGLYLSSPFGEAVSLRRNDSYGAMEAMVARSAYTQLGYSPALLFGTLIGMLLVYLAAPVVVLGFPVHGDGDAAILAGAAWGLMSIAYWPTLRRYGKPWWNALALPLAGAFYGWFTWLSAWRHWRGRGGAWKGRTYPSVS